MENVEKNNQLKLAYAELTMGNLVEAERYFKMVLDKQKSGFAWVGLGSTKLSQVFKNRIANPDENLRTIKYAFYCFRQARECEKDQAKNTESGVLQISLNHIKKSYEQLKIYFDDLKKHKSDATTNIVGAWIVNGLTKSYTPLEHHFDQSSEFAKEQINNITNAYNILFDIAKKLFESTVPYVKFATDHRDHFINEVENLDAEFLWYATDEKEKKRILREQENARKQVKNSAEVKAVVQPEYTIPAWSPWFALIIVISAILVIIRIFQMIL